MPASGTVSTISVDVNQAIQNLSKLNQAFSSFGTAAAGQMGAVKDSLGRFGEGITQVVSTAQRLDEAGNVLSTTTTKIDSFGRTFQEVTKFTKDGAHTITSETQSMAKAQTQALSTVQTQIKALETAYRGALTAMKGGDNKSLEMWNAQIQQLSASLAKVQQEFAAGTLTTGLDNASGATARLNGLMAELTQATAQYNAQKAAIENGQAEERQAERLQVLKATISELSAAYSNYLTATRSGNTEGQTYWQNQITAMQSALTAMRENVTLTNEEREALERADQATVKFETDMRNLQNQQAAKAQTNQIRELEQAYRQLSNAYSNYMKAFKSGDSAGMATWRDQIQAAQAYFDKIRESVNVESMEESQRIRINALIQQAARLAADQAAEEQRVTAQKERQRTVMNSINSAMSWLISMVVIRGIRTLWRNAITYATEYYDRLNEIRVVTGKSQEEAMELGAQFREIASEMSVSSTEIASAATLFFRQGLGDMDVMERLEATIQYAKVTGVEVAEAAEIVTAAVNSMGLDAERVTDVLVYLGDNAGTSGEEVGKAMQKAAAAANNAGVEFEWLGAWIATISETTRVSAESIGTAVNTMMARLHSIRTTGYNSEDETTVNDIAKALKTVDIELMDQYGNWRRMDIVLQELAERWGTITEKQQSYISTTMAGVRAQNYFLALMNDMSKGAEGGSRAFELYAGAIEAAGTTSEKYAVWQESITAAQERMKVAWENFYALLQQDVFTGWYNNMAGFIAGITGATEAMNGMNLILPVVIASIVVLITKLQGATSIFSLITGAFSAHPFILTAAGVMILMTSIGALLKAAEPVRRTYKDVTEDLQTDLGKVQDSLKETQTSQQELVNKAEKLKDLRKRYIELATQTKLTADEQAEFKDIVKQLTELFPGFSGSIDEVTGRFQQQGEVIDAVNAKIRDYLILAREQGMKEADKAFSEMDTVINDLRELRDMRDRYGLIGTLFDTLLPGSARHGAITRAEQYGYNENTGVFINRNGQAVTTEDILSDTRILPAILERYGISGTFNPQTTLTSLFNLSRGFGSIGVWGNANLTNGTNFNGIQNPYDTFYTLMSSGMDAEAAWNTVFKDLQTVFSRMLAESVENYTQTGAQYTTSVDEARATYGALLAMYKRDDFALPNAVMEGLEQQYGDIASRIDWSDLSTLGEQYQNAANEVKLLYDNAAIFADTIQNSTEMHKVNYAEKRWETARDNYGRNPTESTRAEAEEALAEYNTAIGEWNAMLSGTGNQYAGAYKIDPLVVDLENLATAATTAAEAIDETTEATQRLGDKRRLMEAQKSGFASELQEIMDAGVTVTPSLTDKEGNILQYGRSFDLFAGRTKWNQIKEEKPEIAAAMIQQYPWLDYDETFWGGDYNTDEMLSYFDEAIARAPKLGESFEKAYQGITEAAETAKEASEGAGETMDAYLQGWLDVLAGGGDTDAYLASIMDPDNPDALGNQVVAMVKQMESEIEAELGNPEEDGYLSNYTRRMTEEVEGLINGSAENIKLQFQSVADTTGLTVEQQIEKLGVLYDTLEGDGAIENFKNAWAGLDDSTKKSLRNMTGWTDEFIDGLDDSEDSVRNLQTTIARIRLERLEKLGKVMSGTKQLFDSAASGGEAFASASSALNSKINSITGAYQAYLTVMSDIDTETEEYTSAIKTLSSATGVAEESLRDGSGMSMALQNIQEQAWLASESVLALVNMLATSGAISVDPSSVVNGYLAIGEEAEADAQRVAYFINEALKLLGASIEFNPDGEGGGSWSVTGFGAGVNPVVPAVKKSGTGGGGGGGGGGGKKSESEVSESQRTSNWLSSIMWEFDIIQDMLDRLDIIKSTYSTEGKLTGIINVLQQQIELSHEKLKQLETAKDSIGEEIERVKAKMAGLDEGSEEYQEWATILGTLQDKYADVDKKILQTQGDIASFTKEIEEHRLAIKQLEADLQNTILSAINDRDEREEASFDARVELEDKIIEVIKKRYEEERDAAIEASNAKIDALKKESSALREALDERKKLKEEEDKQAELASLQAQYARISADPTRAKEAQEIYKKIVSLQEEIAWDEAEKEVERQQKAIDKQIEEEEKNQRATEKYYEELLSDPRNFAEEAAKIMAMSSNEIVKWLKENDEEYLKSTDLTREKLEKGWEETMNTIAKTIRTKWAEVASIMAGGEEAIISFLKENDQEYLEASESEREIIEAGWRKQLHDIQAAKEEISPEVEPHDFLNYFLTYYKAATEMLTSQPSASTGTPSGEKKRIPASTELGLAEIAKKKKFASGGVIDFTGPAWVDGSATVPEYIMNKGQMEAVRGLIQSLEKVATVSVSGLLGWNAPTLKGANSGMYFGDVILNIEGLNSDSDYEEMAERVMDAISEKMNRGVAVGGVRMG